MSEIAVLLTTHNGKKYLPELLDSLFAQTFSDFTIYVHDDGSKDGSLSIVADYANKYPGRITVLKGPAAGSAKANFLWMLEQVEADTYFFCDQDDVWLPEKVEKSINALEKLQSGKPTSSALDQLSAEELTGTVLSEISTEEPTSPVLGELSTPACIFTDMYVVDASLNILSDSFIRYLGRDPKNTAYTQILIDNPAAGCAMCFNRALRDIATGIGGINLEHIPMHDAWILELAAIFGRVSAIDEPLVYYRQTGENVMGAATENSADKVTRNSKNILAGDFLARKKAFINEAKLFARELLRIPDLPADKKQVLQDFVTIDKKNKFARMHFYKKNNFTRAQHNLWMRLWV